MSKSTLTSSSYLCEECKSIFSEDSEEWWKSWHQEHPEGITRRDEYPATHHPLDQSFRDAVAAGCWLCNQIDSHRDRLYADTTDSLNYYLRDSSTNERLLAFSKNGCRVSIRKVENRTPFYSLALKSKSNPSTGCDDLARLTAEWLRICCASHQCLQYQESPWYPTRLLKFSDDTVRMIHTKDEPDLTSPYAALSYCWGKTKFEVLTSSTIQKFREGINVHSLPKTFQETMHF
ncbi:uncharacterized protein F4822DRAFT_296928 [Hypoxylon trugodes]|uniref:uncharacterized protein n=1 Tax=Hypoxylon trugodes TaxID=326681 RepID=UPI00219449C9|nr:uncharacterized protein F4822DRAFT_296928 [Hypoxylon trugodes]KAI1387956.1 hypothetical protein F4822DRAFT_296928 [Hypoxylon trugodes]